MDKINPFQNNYVSDMGAEDEIILPPLKVRRINVENMPAPRERGVFSIPTPDERLSEQVFLEAVPGETSIAELAYRAAKKDKIKDSHFKSKWDREDSIKLLAEKQGFEPWPPVTVLLP